jgi:flavin-dependent dehydrogenase
MEKIVVIGAGPAGAVASSYLAKNGFGVVVLEKEGFPRFVIGESLLPQCMDSLEEAGLIPHLIDKGYQKKLGATYFSGELTCAFSFSQQYSKSWDWTWNVQRMSFDKDLALGAQANGVDFVFGAKVTAVDIHGKDRWVTYETPDQREVRLKASFVIDASGYGRVLPRLFDLERPSVQKPRSAVFAHFKDSKRKGREGEDIFILPYNEKNAWMWVIPFADGTASMGLVAETDEILGYTADDYRGFLDFVRNFPPLKGRFSEPELVRDPVAIHGYSVAVKRMYGEGFVLCGNSTEFLDPVFSSGVTLAAYSGLQAAKLVARELQGEQVEWQTEYEEEVLRGVEVFRSYVDGWYRGDLHTIFFHPDINGPIKDRICSVLAGHVWDQTNPFVRKHKTVLSTLAKVIRISEKVPSQFV